MGFDLHANRGPELQAVASTFVSLAFTATALRIYVRSCIVKAFGWDDAFMVVALLAHILFAACAIGGIKYGTGRHMAALSSEEIFMALRYWWICYVGYCWAMIASKISIGLFLLRVTIRPVQRWIIYIAMFLTVICGLTFFFVTLFQCYPIDFFWDRSNPKGSCVPIDVIIGLTFLYSAVSIITDFTFAILPMFLVWGLNMSQRTKLVLIPILGMACVASVAVVVRLAYVMDFKDPDFLWATVDVAIWSDIEQGLAITAGSLATLRPLFRKLADKFGWQSTNNPSGPSGKRTPHWKGISSTDSRKKPSSKFSLTGSLFRTEKGPATQAQDDEYGMGNLQPIRLRDDIPAATSYSESSEKGFNTWTVQAGKRSDEELRAGTIVMQREFNAHSSQA